MYYYYKDNAVGNVVAETGRVGGTTTRLSGLSMPFPLCASPLKGEVRRSPEPSARPYGEEGRFDVAARSETPKPPAKTTNSNSCDRVVAQVRITNPNNPGESTAIQLTSTEQISKKGIKLIPQTIGNRKLKQDLPLIWVFGHFWLFCTMV